MQLIDYVIVIVCMALLTGLTLYATFRETLPGCL